MASRNKRLCTRKLPLKECDIIEIIHQGDLNRIKDIGCCKIGILSWGGYNLESLRSDSIIIEGLSKLSNFKALKRGILEYLTFDHIALKDDPYFLGKLHGSLLPHVTPQDEPSLRQFF